LLISCGTTDRREFTQTDFDLVTYAAKFEAFTHTRIGDIPIGFGELSDDAVGACRQFIDKNGHVLYSEIIINQKYYEQLTNNTDSLEIVVFHELGHCRLGIQGHNSVMINGCPESLMRANTFDDREIERCYKPYKAYYIKELLSERVEKLL
jgi:hypothetical protein